MHHSPAQLQPHPFLVQGLASLQLGGPRHSHSPMHANGDDGNLVWQITDPTTGKLVPQVLQDFARAVGHVPMVLVLIFGKKRQGKSTLTSVITGVNLPSGGGEEAITRTISLVGPFSPQQIAQQLGPQFQEGLPPSAQIVFVDTRGLGDLCDQAIELDLHRSLVPFQLLSQVRLLAVRERITSDQLQSLNQIFKLHDLVALMSRMPQGARGSMYILKTAHECCDWIEAQAHGPTEADMRQQSQDMQGAVDDAIACAGLVQLAQQAVKVVCLPNIHFRNPNRSRAELINKTLLSETLRAAIRAATPMDAANLIRMARLLADVDLQAAAGDADIFQRVHQQVIDGAVTETEHRLLSRSSVEINRQPKQYLQRLLTPDRLNSWRQELRSEVLQAGWEALEGGTTVGVEPTGRTCRQHGRPRLSHLRAAPSRPYR